MQYLVQCGRQPEFAIAELQATLPDCKIIDHYEEWVMLETEVELNQTWLDKIGSIPAISKIIDTITNFQDCRNPDTIVQKIQKTTIKRQYAVNYLPEHMAHPKVKQQVLLKLKKIAKEQEGEGKVRFLNKNNKNCHTAYLYDQGWKQNKIDLIQVIKILDKIFITKTVGLQDLNSYSFRDYQKPARDMQRGMFPPKLAQTLLNLAQVKDGSTVYDPFCGIGTVLMEGLLMNLNVIGSDLDPKAIEDSQLNLDWLKQKFKQQLKPELSCQIFEQDAIKIADAQVDWKKVDAIVSEGYLGKLMHHAINPTHPGSIENFDNIDKIYVSFFKSLKSVINENTEIVISLPVFRTSPESYMEGKLYFLKNTVEKIEALGYIKAALNEQSLVYIRPQQIVGREVLKFKLHIPR